jgi:ParB family transcriptional regulator, chromosome partitioning protein
MFPSRSRSTNAAHDAAQNTRQDVEPRATQELRELPVASIEPSLCQPRRYFDEGTLQELAASIGEFGVLQPVLVRPGTDGSYELIAGERRWHAANIAGLETIPALVSTYDDREAIEAALIENMAREDLNPVEQARAFSTLVNEFGMTLEQIGRSVGRSTGTVSNMVRLLKLSEEILEFIERGQLGWAHGTALLRVRDLEARQQLARVAVSEGLTCRALEARVRASNREVLESLQDRGEQAQGAVQARDLDALNLARAWGDLLGAEVHVRTMRKEQMRMEVEFDFAAEGLALAERLASVVAGGSTGR